MSENLITYAQNREDLYLFALLGHIENGFYIDIGAYDETLHSVTKLFSTRGWRGVNVDANPKLMEPFYKNRPTDINLCAGVSNKVGQMVFREYPHHSGLSTLDPGMQNQHGTSEMPFIDYSVPVTTIKAIAAEHSISHVDFLKVDVEGHELEVLEGNDWSALRPTVVTFEASRGAECIAFMEASGYRHEFFDGLNHYFVDKNSADVTIYNYAGRILSHRIPTLYESQLVASYEQQIAQLSGSPVTPPTEKFQPIAAEPGIKQSAHHLRRALARRLKTRRPGR
jgi:FkbM family methyltransferase